ncbi:MAG: SEC-C metal-binding domain-containing protein [Veillonellales bacterium]
MKIRVPKKLTKEIEKLCYEINPGEQPVYIPVDNKTVVASDADCVEMVALKMLKDGGSFQFGWAIWEWPDVMLEAEFWAVWVNDDGQLVDVTPRGRGENLLFIIDNKTKFEGKPIDSMLKPLIEHPLVLEYININKKIWQQADALTEAGKSAMAICEILAPVIDKKDALEREIEEKISGGIGRNDLCPCGSGKKFKNCCGH